MHLTTRIAAGATVFALAASAPVVASEPTRESQADQGGQVSAPAAPPATAPEDR